MIEINTPEKDIASLQSMFDSIPLVGNTFKEILFHINPQLKRKRVEEFVKILKDLLSRNSSLDPVNLNSEDFGEFLESVLRKVAITKSTFKLERFRDLLVNQLSLPQTNDDIADTFAELVLALSETEIRIVYNHRHFDGGLAGEGNDSIAANEEANNLQTQLNNEEILKFQGLANNYDSVVAEINRLSQKTVDYNAKVEKLNELRTATYYSIDDDRFLYYKQNLASKGLLIDYGASYLDHIPFSYMSITKFGKDFLNYVTRPDAQLSAEE